MKTLNSTVLNKSNLKLRLQGILIGTLITIILLSSTLTFATGLRENKTIDVVLNAVGFKVNGKVVEADSLNYGGANYVSVRVISEMLEKDIVWDADNNTVNINDKIISPVDMFKVSLKEFIEDKREIEVKQFQDKTWSKIYFDIKDEEVSYDIVNMNSLITPYKATVTSIETGYRTNKYSTKEEAEKDNNIIAISKSKILYVFLFKDNKWELSETKILEVLPLEVKGI